MRRRFSTVRRPHPSDALVRFIDVPIEYSYPRDVKSTKPIVVAMVSLLTLFTAIAVVGVIGDATSGKDNAARSGPASEWFAGWATAVALVVGPPRS